MWRLISPARPLFLAAGIFVDADIRVNDVTGHAIHFDIKTAE